MTSRLRLALASVAAVALLTACTPKNQTIDADLSPSASDTRISDWVTANGSTLNWTECDLADEVFGEGDLADAGIEDEANAGAELEEEAGEPLDLDCALMTVPVDWFTEDTATTHIPLLRVGATGDDPLGSIVLNPGGPGGSGTETALGMAVDPSTAELLDSYSLIGFDPRGVAGPLSGADPLECTEYTSHGCEATELLAQHASSTAVAHDMEYLRIVLGGDRMNYLGYSYGTYLGAIYATLFPTEVGAMVLDGTTTADDYSLDGLDEQEEAMSESKDRFLRACLAGELGPCPVSGSLNDAYAALDRASDDLDKHPVTIDQNSRVDGDSINLYLDSALYGDRSTWPDIAETLTGVLAGDRDALAAIAGEDSTVDTSMNDAVICAIEQGRDGQDCGNQPVIDPEVSYSDSSEILVFAVTGDPATPYLGARHFVDELGNATLVTVIGEGHGATYGQSTCASEVATRYFVDGTVPAANTRCAADVR
ncbi:MAG: alpha/beta hydrolase [Mycetocola sp.]